MGGKMGRQKVAEFCDVCKEERLSVLDGDNYICEFCLDGRPPGTVEARVKV